MRQERRSRPLLTLAALCSLTLLAACENRPISSDFWHDLQEYQSKPHYRAFVMTPGGPRQGRAMAMAWRRGSIDVAIQESMTRCQRYETGHQCKLQYIGDIFVGDMTEEEIEKAKKVYRENVSATNEDL